MISADLEKPDLPLLMLPLELQTTAAVSADGRWQVRATHADGDRAGKKATMDLNQASVRLAIAELEASAEGHLASFDAAIRLGLPAYAVTGRGMNLNVGRVEGVGHYRQPGKDGNGTVTLTLGSIAMQNKDMAARVRTVSRRPT